MRKVRARPTAYEVNAPDSRLVTAALAGSEHRVFWVDEADEFAPTAPSQPLPARIAADLVVVGGGYLGLWSAVLAKRRDPGRNVVLLEAHTLGWAASGRNGGFCVASITHGEANGRARWPDEFEKLDSLGRQNFAEFAGDVTDYDMQCQWEPNGALRVAVESHQLAWLPSDALDAAGVRAEINSPLFLGGAWSRDSVALIQPVMLVRELARVARHLGVEIFEHSPVASIDAVGSGKVEARTPRATVSADRAILATNVFPSLLRRNRLMTVPVYDYVLVTEPLSSQQLATIGWHHRQGLEDMANQFHYSRLTACNRIMYGGYDAIYHRGRRVAAAFEERPETFERLTSHLLATFPELEGIRVTHRWAGAIDTCTQFAPFYGCAHKGRVAYAAGFTGLGVGATRFAAQVLLDLLSGEQTERTQLEAIRRRPLPFPREPVTSLGIGLARWSMDRADHRRGQRNMYLRTLDRMGLGFDS